MLRWSYKSEQYVSYESFVTLRFIHSQTSSSLTELRSLQLYNIRSFILPISIESFFVTRCSNSRLFPYVCVYVRVCVHTYIVVHSEKDSFTKLSLIFFTSVVFCIL